MVNSLKMFKGINEVKILRINLEYNKDEELNKKLNDELNNGWEILDINYTSASLPEDGNSSRSVYVMYHLGKIKDKKLKIKD